MGCCCSTEDRRAPQDRGPATHSAVRDTANSPSRKPPASTTSRQNSKRGSEAKLVSVPSPVITAIDEELRPAITAIDDEPQAEKPPPLPGKEPLPPRPKRHLSVIGADPREEFRIPELAYPVLPPERICYEGYAPPVPEKVREDHPRRAGMPVEPPPLPPKELEGPPVPPPKPGELREEMPATPSTELHRSPVAELPSPRRAAELAGPAPPAELENAHIPDPRREKVRVRYQDAVLYAPNPLELPAARAPPSRSVSLYSPHLAGGELGRDVSGPIMQARIASRVDTDGAYYEMDAADTVHELDDRGAPSQRQVVGSLIPDDVRGVGARGGYGRGRGRRR